MIKVGKKYKVINNDSTQRFGVCVGDIGEVVEYSFDVERSGTWLYNAEWKEDAI